MLECLAAPDAGGVFRAADGREWRAGSTESEAPSWSTPVGREGVDLGRLTFWPAQAVGEEEAAAARDIAHGLAISLAREKAGKRLERMDRVAGAGELAVGAAHEMAQPLQAIAGHVALLQAGRGGAESLDAISRGVERLAGHIDRMRDYARVTPMAQETVELRELVHRAIELTGAALRRSVTIHGGHGTTVQGDFSRLEQVIVNLLSNAFGVGASVVEIAIGSDPAPFIDVRDDGPGVPPELRESIFAAFFSTRADGVGLGLSLSARIMSEHGGRIEVRESQGSGAIFRVWFPPFSGPH